MNLITKITFIVVALLVSLYFIGVGFIMQKNDFSDLPRFGFMSGRIEDDTPENRMKISKSNGFWFIMIGCLMFPLLCASILKS